MFEPGREHSMQYLSCFCSLRDYGIRHESPPKRNTDLPYTPNYVSNQRIPNYFVACLLHIVAELA